MVFTSAPGPQLVKFWLVSILRRLELQSIKELQIQEVHHGVRRGRNLTDSPKIGLLTHVYSHLALITQPWLPGGHGGRRRRLAEHTSNSEVFEPLSANIPVTEQTSTIQDQARSKSEASRAQSKLRNWFHSVTSTIASTSVAASYGFWH